MNRILMCSLALAIMGLSALAADSQQNDTAKPIHELQKGEFDYHSKDYKTKTPAELAEMCEKERDRLKSILPKDLSSLEKENVDYHLKIIAIELEELRKPGDQPKRGHYFSCRHHLKSIIKIIEKHASWERKNKHKMDRDSEREKQKAEREAIKARDGSRDYGKSEGEDKKPAGSDAKVSENDAKKAEEVEEAKEKRKE